MGRSKKNQYHKSLHQQIHERLVAMQAFGDSRREDKRRREDRGKIYSFSTYQTYRRAAMRFAKYIEQTHPDCTTMKKGKRYVNEWLQSRQEEGVSNWTLAMETSALCKLYGILPDDPERFHPPARRREDIQRSRGDAKRDAHFSVKNNDELIKFVCATGTRRGVLERLRGDQLWSRERMEAALSRLGETNKLTDGEAHQLTLLRQALLDFPEFAYFIYHSRDKGGKSRFAPVRSELQELVVRRMEEAGPTGLVFQRVHDGADIHHYRGVYARNLYRRFARKIEDIPYDRINRGSGKRYQSEVYCCRGDEKGRKLDRRALLLVSRALGHNRVNVVAENYLYGL